MKQHLYSMALLFAAITGFAVTVLAQDALPKLPATGKATAAFIPAGWKVIHRTSTDFNKDKLMDEAMLLGSDQRSMLAILFAGNDGYQRSFTGTFSSAEYISKLGTRGNTLQLVFDLPSYSGGHLITVYARYQDADWYIIGYTEETHESYDAPAGRGNNPKGLLKDVNLVTGAVVEQTLRGNTKTPKKQYKQAKAPLVQLKDLDRLEVMNW